MGIALVPPCRDVQWVGPVPAEESRPTSNRAVRLPSSFFRAVPLDLCLREFADPPRKLVGPLRETLVAFPPPGGLLEDLGDRFKGACGGFVQNVLAMK